MTVRFCFYVPLLAALALAGCTSSGPFPSLALRPGEGNIMLAEPMHPAPILPDDPALRQRVASLLAQANAGGQAFGAAYPGTVAAVSRAGAPGSDSWVSAQVALSRLETSRGDTSAALAALAQLSTDRSEEPTSAADFAAIEAAIANVGGIVQGQEAQLEQLRDRLGSGS